MSNKPRINRTSKPVVPSASNPYANLPPAQAYQGGAGSYNQGTPPHGYTPPHQYGYGDQLQPPQYGYGTPQQQQQPPQQYGYGGGGYGTPDQQQQPPQQYGYGQPPQQYGYGGGYGTPEQHPPTPEQHPPTPEQHPPTPEVPVNPSQEPQQAQQPPPSSSSSEPNISTLQISEDPQQQQQLNKGPRATGVFCAADVVKGEIMDIVDDAAVYRDYVKNMQGRKVTEEDSVWLKEKKDDLEQRLKFIHEMLSQCELEMVPEEFEDTSVTFSVLCTQLQAMFKVASKRERKRYTVTQEAGAMGTVAMESGDIAKQLEMERVAMEQEQQQQQQQQYELNIDPRWSIAHPLLQGGQLMEYTDEDLMDERQQEMLYIQRETENLAALLEEQNAKVEEQEQQVLVVEQNTEESSQNVEEGVEHILKASRGRKYKMVAGGGLVIGAAIGAGAGAIGGPATMAAGAAVGAAIGFGLGYGTAKAMQHKRDLDAFKLHLDKKWVNDKHAKACADCKKSFTTTRRKHHCRYCGNVFCAKCTAKRIKLPKVDWPRAERVCNPCFSAILECNYEERKGIAPVVEALTGEEPQEQSASESSSFSLFLFYLFYSLFFSFLFF